MKDVRCQGTPVFTDCAAPTFPGFYKFIEELGASGAESPLHRACSLVRKEQMQRTQAQRVAGGSLLPLTMVQEELQQNEEFSLENEAISRAFDGAGVTSEGIRLSFFASRIADVDDLVHQSDKEFLGYVIIKRNAIAGQPPRANIYEAVLRMPQLLNNYIHSSSSFESRCADKVFSVQGAFYAQQNGISNVCATAALRMVLSNLPQFQGRRLTNEELNGVMNIAPQNVSHGASAAQIEAALNHYQVPWAAQDYFLEPNEDYWKFLHSILDWVVRGF